MSFKDLASSKFEISKEQLAFIISGLCIEHAYLADSPKVDNADLECFMKLKMRTATEAELRNSLYTLTRMMHAHYDKQVILLIDEYDVPLSKANEHGYYQEMLDIIRSVMSIALKTNDYLKFYNSKFYWQADTSTFLSAKT